MFTLRLTTICLHFDSLFYFDILFFFYHTKMFTIWLTTIFIHCDRIFYFNILFLFDIFPCSSFTTKYLQCLVARLSDSHCFSFNYIIWKRSWMGSTVCSRYLFFLIWLILPVVICLFERLSHACLSINCWEYFWWLDRRKLIISVLFDLMDLATG